MSVRTKDRWDVAARPQYLIGVLAAADQAKREGVKAISVMEFGVAGGNGLLALQECAEMVERETGIQIMVYGFDTGKGLPQLCGDHRDHPDQWISADYAMNDEKALRRRLGPRSSLVLGTVSDTVPQFVDSVQQAPVGFIAVDVDLYSSTKDALQILSLPNKSMLRRVPMYFDDVDYIFNHRFAGELLAIDEFNAENKGVKIDMWRGVSKHRVFPESAWLNNMYVAHDLEAIAGVKQERKASIWYGLQVA